MEVVGQRNRGKEQGQDADQSDEALPFPTGGRGRAQLRQPTHTPDEQERRGHDQPDRIEEKFHPAMILEQAGARGNSGGGRVCSKKCGGSVDDSSETLSCPAGTPREPRFAQDARTAVLLLHFRTGVRRRFGGVCWTRLHFHIGRRQGLMGALISLHFTSARD